MPRKPKQERAVLTVNSIVEASARCIAKHGIANTTTQHIAKLAGVSVGSIYEYFSNKEEIFDSLIERFVAEIADMIKPKIAELAPNEIDVIVTEILNSIRVLLISNDNLYLDAAQQIFQVDIQSYIMPLTDVLSELILQFVMHHPEYIQIKNIPTMSYIFINGCVFSIFRYLTDPNPPISFDDLTLGLSKMISHFLKQELFEISQS